MFPMIPEHRLMQQVPPIPPLRQKLNVIGPPKHNPSGYRSSVNLTSKILRPRGASRRWELIQSAAIIIFLFRHLIGIAKVP